MLFRPLTVLLATVLVLSRAAEANSTLTLVAVGGPSHTNFYEGEAVEAPGGEPVRITVSPEDVPSWAWGSGRYPGYTACVRFGSEPVMNARIASFTWASDHWRADFEAQPAANVQLDLMQRESSALYGSITRDGVSRPITLPWICIPSYYPVEPGTYVGLAQGGTAETTALVKVTLNAHNNGTGVYVEAGKAPLALRVSGERSSEYDHVRKLLVEDTRGTGFRMYLTAAGLDFTDMLYAGVYGSGKTVNFVLHKVRGRAEAENVQGVYSVANAPEIETDPKLAGQLTVNSLGSTHLALNFAATSAGRWSGVKRPYAAIREDGTIAVFSRFGRFTLVGELRPGADGFSGAQALEAVAPEYVVGRGVNRQTVPAVALPTRATFTRRP